MAPAAVATAKPLSARAMPCTSTPSRSRAPARRTRRRRAAVPRNGSIWPSAGRHSTAPPATARSPPTTRTPKQTSGSNAAARRGLAVAVPAPQRGLRVDRPAVDVDLEVEVAADVRRCRSRRRRRPARPSRPARRGDTGRPAQVGVEVAAVARLRRGSAGSCRRGPGRSRAAAPCRAHRDQRRPAGGDDVEAFVDAAAAARRAELPDRPPRPVRPRTGKTWP